MFKSRLWDSIETYRCQTIAVMGMAKNTGKTVALNHLLQAAVNHSVLTGITSIGRDGETHDQVFLHPKPLVVVPKGTLIATARDTLNRARINWKKLTETPCDSSMGRIWIVEASEDGEVEIAGAARGSDQKENMTLLREYGAQKIFLDGALGRSHHASPALADGVILATGAALGGEMQDVLRKTKERLELLTLPAVSESENKEIRDVLQEEAIGVWDQNKKHIPLQARATLTGAKELLSVTEPIGKIALAGAVGQMVWKAILEIAAKKPIRVVIVDGTRLFIDRWDVARLEELGGTLEVLDPIRILGITLNPVSPYGRTFDPVEFMNMAKEKLNISPIVDVMTEEFC